ncbi:MAG: o-succinylbenzoate synthase [Endomicrobiales bacterium]
MRESKIKIKKINIFRYCLPFRRPVLINSALLKVRTGLIVEIITDKGIRGYGEIAPLPGLSIEDIGAALEELSLVKEKLLKGKIRATALGTSGLYPSVRYGLESALCGISETTQQSLFCGSLRNKKEISVNALISIRDPGFKEQLRALIRNNFRSIKVKVNADSLAADRKNIDILNTMLAPHPRIKVRIDLNRKSGLDESVALCRLFDRTRVEYVEEPTSEIARLKEFHKRTRLGFALDESLPSLAPRALKGLTASGLKAVILKPTMLGGISRTLSYIKMAQKLGLRSVVSSSYEVGPGFVYALKLASCAESGTAHGLDTLKKTGCHLLPADVSIRNAKIRVIKSYHFNRDNRHIRSAGI